MSVRLIKILFITTLLHLNISYAEEAQRYHCESFRISETQMQQVEDLSNEKIEFRMTRFSDYIILDGEFFGSEVRYDIDEIAYGNNDYISVFNNYMIIHFHKNIFQFIGLAIYSDETAQDSGALVIFASCERI